jgi:hypothetical protein
MFAPGLVFALSNPRRTAQQDLLEGKRLKPIRFDNGVPVYRFRVQAVPVGEFLTADNEPFKVTPQSLNHWAKTFKAFSNRGIPVPVLRTVHTDQQKIDEGTKAVADASAGKVVGMDVTGNGQPSLWMTVELVGKDAPKLAASNSVSIYAEPEWTDAKGNKYEWPIRHLLMTPDPRIPGLSGFTPIAASNGKTYKVPVLRYKNMATRNSPGRQAIRSLRQGQSRRASLAFAHDCPIPHPYPKGGKKGGLPTIALDELGSENENGLGVPGVGDGAMLPESEGSTMGDLNAVPKDSKGLKQHIKDHFSDRMHTVVDDEMMEHKEKLEAIKELLAELERILEAFTDEEDSGPAEFEPEAEEGSRGAAMGNKKPLPEMECAGMSNAPMAQLRKQIGARDAQLAQITSGYRREKINSLWAQGKISPIQKQQLENQFLDPRHVSLSLSNDTFGNSFDQAIALLAANEMGLYESTGPQHNGNRNLALGNEFRSLPNGYVVTQQDVDAQYKEDKEMCLPSAMRANGKKK